MATILKTVTLGCKVNQYETEYVREALVGIGYRDARPGETADLCIVNTCTVTHEGDAKSRQVIRRLARDNPGARILVMGCYATRAPQELAALPAVAEVVTDKRELPDLLGRFGIVDIPTGISGFGNRHRAYLKVQDGCLLSCSYCVIPQVRPYVLSRPISQVLDEVRRLLDNGYRELVLTGVHLGHFGVEANCNKSRLAELVREIASINGDFRVRVSSIEATEVTRELVDVVAEHPDKVCPHLHICLQSGSDRVLRRMRRRWATRMFVDRCQTIRERLTLPALTTDVIVGFPGETPEDFDLTCRVVRDVGFSKIHIFRFSQRQGTPAATFPDQIPHSIKADRARRLAEIEQEMRQAYFSQLVGKPLQVLVESVVDGRENRVVGTACRYVPVELSGTSSLRGQLVDCQVVAANSRRLEGR